MQLPSSSPSSHSLKCNLRHCKNHACSIVGSRTTALALLFDATGKALNCLQRAQITWPGCFDVVICKLRNSGWRSVDLLLELHWLLVQARDVYKVALLCLTCYKLGLPTYLSLLPKQYTPTHSLRSSSQDLLTIPRSRTKTAARHFSLVAPRVVWNSVLATVRAASSVGSFRSQLHTCTISASSDHVICLNNCFSGNNALNKN